MVWVAAAAGAAAVAEIAAAAGRSQVGVQLIRLGSISRMGITTVAAMTFAWGWHGLLCTAVHMCGSALAWCHALEMPSHRTTSAPAPCLPDFRAAGKALWALLCAYAALKWEPPGGAGDNWQTLCCLAALGETLHLVMRFTPGGVPQGIRTNFRTCAQGEAVG